MLKFFFSVNLLLGFLVLIEISRSYNSPYFSVSGMNVLIVESEYDLGLIWQRALEQLGVKVVLVTAQGTAVQALQDQNFELIAGFCA